MNELEDIITQLVDHTYVYVEWPESQEYMEEDWFEEEAVLDVAGNIGSSYFIPTKRVYEKR